MNRLNRPRGAYHPGVIAGCIVLAALIPGSCVLTCASAPRAIDGMLAACRESVTDDCRERVGSDNDAFALHRALTKMAAYCGTAPTFETSGIHLHARMPWDMTANVKGDIVAGTCTLPKRTIELEGHPFAWRLVDMRVQ